MLVQTLHRLFFAIKPAPHVIPAIEAARRLYCPGHPVKNEHLHVTMEIFDDSVGMPERLAEALIAIGGEIDVPGFVLPLGRVVGTTRSVALRPKGRSTGLILLQRAIHERVTAAGLSVREGWSFNPHMTLGYRDGSAFARSIDAITWQVDELVLVHSHVGQTRHDILGRWPLAPELPLFE
ncbi:2'-5' RNA ligase family protein [Sphingomonas sp.]|jgi:2'-5' RNA ligase|uniref:2'-5' RNA ligase family protein n=1 Tax=Sphingomonas sp. TaxID=28214 RepID=UPI002E324E2D|nr:2'-5' RNA ligase family protein [Sphingomonas sp.]HEX4695077.1 2'-5' RNA ligase family protein [Sphingomonas sp.]